MARRRYLSTDISHDGRVSLLAEQAGDFAALLYTWMVPHAADDCSIVADPKELRLLVVPGFSKTTEDVAEATAAMVELGLLVPEGKLYIFPPEAFYKYQAYIREDRRRLAQISNDQRKLAQISEEPRELAEIIASSTHSVTPSPSVTTSTSLLAEDAPADAALPAVVEPEPEPEPEVAEEPVEKPKRSRRHSLKEAEDEIPRFREEHRTVDVPREWLKFTNHLKAKSKTFTDYIAAFENWLLNEETYARQRLQTAGRSAGGRQRGSPGGPDVDGWERYAGGEN